MKKYWEYESLEEVRAERKKVLDKEAKEWDKNCRECKKLFDAIEKGILKAGHSWKDRKNPVCDACPSSSLIRGYGVELDELLIAEKCFRLEKGK